MLVQEMSLKNEILRLKKEKDVVILAHNYQIPDVQDVADFTGDSLGLSRQAAKVPQKTILFCGVHFMAETAAIICPEKRVLIPDLQAGCSLSDSITVEELRNWKTQHPDAITVGYVNTTAEIKALTDIVCTSSNAVGIVQSIPKNQKIIFAPDKNLGNYIKSLTGRDMVIWEGSCHVHEEFSIERILELKKIHPDARIIAHPECKKPVLLIADHIGSTSSLLKFTKENSASKYIVATESGIIHQMKKDSPNKEFIPAPPIDMSCACSDCNFMKLITIKKIYNCLKFEKPEIQVNEEIQKKAVHSIRRMLEISKDLGLKK